MQLMLIRRYIIVPIIFWLIGAGIFAFAAGYGSGIYFELNPTIQLAISLGIFLTSAIIILIIKMHSPLKKVIREMKALLTGKSYRRIMTKKTNEIGVLAHFFNEITRNLENISSDVKSHERIRKELNTAQKIQRDLLPKNTPEIPGLEITARTRSASEIGGDTFDFIAKGERNLMYIGDSTGHGVPAGIVMVMVDTLIETFMDLYDKLTDIMIMLNKYLKPHLQTTMFMTMILMEWENKTKKFKWVGAGHEHIIHVQTNKGTVMSTPAGGIAVGMLPDNSKMTKEQEIQLNEGDFIILFSDGITEAKNIAGEDYTLERLKTAAKSHASTDTSTEDLFKKIAIDVGRFMEGAVQLDDMTLIVIKATAKKKEKSTEEKTTEWQG